MHGYVFTINRMGSLLILFIYKLVTLQNFIGPIFFESVVLALFVFGIFYSNGFDLSNFIIFCCTIWLKVSSTFLYYLRSSLIYKTGLFEISSLIYSYMLSCFNIWVISFNVLQLLSWLYLIAFKQMSYAFFPVLCC